MSITTTLYLQNKDIIQSMLDAKTDDDLITLADKFDDLNVALDTAIQAMREYETKAIAVKDEAKRLSELASHYQDKADSIKNMIDQTMKDQGMKRLELDHGVLSYRKSTKTIVDAMVEDIDDKYKKEKVTYTVDKTAIKKDLQDGVELGWARLEVSENLQIK